MNPELLERRADLIELGAADVEALVQPLARQARVSSLALLSGGYCNTNYRFTLEGMDDVFVLRIFARDASACAREAAILSALSSGRLPVPELIFRETSPASRHPDVPAYLVTRFMPGRPVSAILEGASAEKQHCIARELGLIAAQLSLRGYPRAGLLTPELELESAPFPVFSGYVRSMLFDGPAGPRLGTELRDRLWEHVSGVAPVMDAPAKASLVHADFNVTNILVEGDPDAGDFRVSAILDWEFAHSNTALFDFCPLLRDEELRAPGFGDSLASAFKEHGGALPDDWKARVKALDLINMLDAINGERPRPRATARASAIISRTLDLTERPNRPV